MDFTCSSKKSLAISERTDSLCVIKALIIYILGSFIFLIHISLAISVSSSVIEINATQPKDLAHSTAVFLGEVIIATFGDNR